MDAKEFFSTYKKPLAIGCGSVAGVFVIAVIIVAAIFIFGKKKDSYVNVIPKDTFVMARLDAKKLISKNDIKLDDLLSKSKVDADDLKNSGIDVTSPVYGFFASKNVEAGFVAKIDDKEKAREFVEDNAKKILGSTSKKTMSEHEGIYYLGRYKECICIDDDKIMLVYFKYTASDDFDDDGSEAGRMGCKLMVQDKDKSVYDEDIYEEILDSKKPAAVNMDFKRLPDAAKENVDKSASDNELVKAVMNSHLLFAFDIKDEEASLSADILPQTDKAKSIFEEQEEKLGGKIKGDLIGYGMKNAFLWGIGNADGSYMLSQLKNNPVYDQFKSEIESKINIDDIIKSFNGDVVGSLAFTDNINKPEWFVAASVKSDEITNNLPKFFEGESSVTLKNENGGYKLYENISNYYESDFYGDYAYSGDDYAVADSVAPDPSMTSSSQKFLAAIGCKNKVFYCTNSESTDLLKSNYKTVSDKKDDITNSILYIIFDIPAFVKSLEANAKGDTTVKTICKYLKPFDNITLKATSPYHCECILTTKEGKSIGEIINSWL